MSRARFARGRHAIGLSRTARAARAIWRPSLLRRLVRRRLVWWILAVVLAVLGASVFADQRRGLASAKADWGATTPVLVTVRPVPVGEQLAGRTEVRSVPVALVPDDSLSSLPRNAIARVELYPGEIVLAGRVAGTAGRGIPEGFVAMTMQLLGAAPLVERGDLVDVWVVDTTTATSRRVGTRLPVLDRSDDDVTLALPEADAGQAAIAALRPVTLVLVG